MDPPWTRKRPAGWAGLGEWEPLGMVAAAVAAPGKQNGPPHEATGQSNREVQGRIAAPARCQVGWPVIRSTAETNSSVSCVVAASLAGDG
jgi:hypothetical protein